MTLGEGSGVRQVHFRSSKETAKNWKEHTPTFCDNTVSTAKYNCATFFPKFLFEQFSKYANLFFLFTSIIQVCFDE
jgi:hypothetical protein